MKIFLSLPFLIRRITPRGGRALVFHFSILLGHKLSKNLFDKSSVKVEYTQESKKDHKYYFARVEIFEFSPKNVMENAQVRSANHFLSTFKVAKGFAILLFPFEHSRVERFTVYLELS